MKKALLSLFVLSLFGYFSMNAQVTTGSIFGTISDASGEVLIGANVQATHGPSGTVYGTTTRADGGYALPNLRVGGPYSIDISYVGYETESLSDVYVKLGQKLPLNISLNEDATTLDAITITSERNAILRDDKTGAETNITNEQLTKLPTISRSASDYTRLTPAANGNSFAGRNDQFNNFSLDGSIFNNPFGLDAATPGGQTSAQPVSLDAIEQINVSIAPYDVTRSGFTGAAIDAVTKSGTNEVTGTVFGFYRNDGMTGDKVAGTSIEVPDLTQYQAGFTLGFPIIKNKLFAMVNAEIDNREDLGTSFKANRAGATGENVSRVDASDLDLVSQTLASVVGYETGAYEGYLHESNSTKGIIKLDWAINNNHTLSASYNFLDASKDKPAHPNAIGRRGPDLTTLQFANSGYEITNKIQSGIVELRSLFSNTVSNKLQLGFTHFDDSRNPFSTPAPVLNINKDGIRYIVAGHEPFSIHNRLDQKVFQITNNLNIYSGDHTITIGGSLERFEFDNSFNLGVNEPFGFDYPGGTFGPGFASVDDFVAYANSTVEDPNNPGSMISPLAVVFNHAQSTFDAFGGDDGVEGEGWALAETNVGQFAFYLQDEWQATDKLNLTFGVRADIPLYFNTPELAQENIDRNCCHVPDIAWSNENGEDVVFDHTELPKSTPLLSPRFGFNYDIKGDRTSQLRGGSGLFSGRLPFVWIGNQVANPNIFFYTVTDPDYKFPRVWRTNVGIDHKLSSGWILTSDLMYTKDINASIVRNYGIRPPSGNLTGADTRPTYFNDRVIDPFTNAYVFGNTDEGYSFNASFQIQRNFSNGLWLMAGYNYTKAEDASSIEAEISSDAYDRNPALGNVNLAVAAPSLYGTQHRVIIAGTKDFTYGDGKWKTTLSLFGEYAQGGSTPDDFTADYRFSYTYSGDINGDGSGLNDLLYIPTDAELDAQSWASDAQRNAFRSYIEQDDYLSERRGQYAEKYAVLAPFYSQWDFRLLQDFNFKAGERTNTLQFSLDILNIGNLISSDWGVKQLPSNSQPVGVSVDQATGVPTYSFDESLTSTYTNDFTLLSRWQARVGLRYIF